MARFAGVKMAKRRTLEALADSADDEDEDQTDDGLKERREGVRELADVDVRRKGERLEVG
ncbi:uncharacterized protein TrAFT101_007562 [Trichoderma asperellum]|uniref:uncharacterized protein n=1 Tax=Trichoderma asperellum TaxID=101201 RepID=UPI00332B6CF0|nr:hypothetical protein TrAFT101_007562 [Trichoderma asperellum]